MSGDDQTFTIAELSREFGVTARTLRFYEDEGLLSPVRDGTNRIYSKADRGRLAWVLRGKRTGFSLAEIKELLDLYNREDGREEQRRATIVKCDERLVSLEAQRADIDQIISELTEFRAQLQNRTLPRPTEQISQIIQPQMAQNMRTAK